MHAPQSILPLSVEALTYVVRGKALVDAVSFEIRRGEKTIILGPNGAGKSLTLRLCHGLLKPTSGSVRWSGSATTGGRKRHAMVFQRPVLLRRSALANILHALSLGGGADRDRRQRAISALERFGLADLARRPARVLSGGEQQRLAMARAWALRPEVLFLDEPTAALDPAATRAVEEMIEAFHADGMTIVMTTHDLPQARRLADEVMFLHHGRLLERAPAQEFFAAPRSDAARAFVKGELLW
jgi:tungstate transport system ATP-binding protein